MKNINLIKEAIEMVKELDQKDFLEASDKENNKVFLKTLNEMLDGSRKFNEEYVELAKEYTVVTKLLHL